MKNNPIPADHSSWGTFNKLTNHNEDDLHGILDEAAKDKAAKPGSNWQKIGDFYGSCMDESAIEAAGLKPLEPNLRASRRSMTQRACKRRSRACSAKA